MTERLLPNDGGFKDKGQHLVEFQRRLRGIVAPVETFALQQIDDLSSSSSVLRDGQTCLIEQPKTDSQDAWSIEYRENERITPLVYTQTLVSEESVFDGMHMSIGFVDSKTHDITFRWNWPEDLSEIEEKASLLPGLMRGLDAAAIFGARDYWLSFSLGAHDIPPSISRGLESEELVVQRYEYSVPDRTFQISQRNTSALQHLTTGVYTEAMDRQLGLELSKKEYEQLVGEAVSLVPTISS